MEAFSVLLALCAGNSLVNGEFPSQRPVTRSFDVFFDLCLRKQTWGWWFETQSCSLWRRRNEISFKMLTIDTPIHRPGNRKSRTLPHWVYGYGDLHYGTALYSVSHTERPHDDVIKRKHFPRYWPFVRGIHRSPVNSPHKGQWRGALMFSLICACINGWASNREVGDLRRHRAHYDVTVMPT